MTKPSTIFLAAGGTGGHIFPAIALGEELHKRSYNVVLVTDKRTKKYLDDSKNLSIEFISATYPYGSLKNKLLGSISQITSYFQARKLIKKYNAKCVVGFGVRGNFKKYQDRYP
jgi:UDP-N-acetylglucosamine--N-acetylmuramyl-(pentapeptide) pyrophosphoryl-undecaprenol N-acetylglucosamine transferase